MTFRNSATGTFHILFLVLLSASLQAAIVTVPPGLNLGDQYRLVFITPNARNASFPLVSEYNSFVQSAADASPLAALGQTWKAIVSVNGGPNAKTNTGTDPVIDGVGVPIYGIDGIKVADHNNDFWDTTLDAPIKRGPDNADYTDSWVWTGSEPSGVEDDAIGGGTTSTIGRNQYTNGLWAMWGRTDNAREFQFYAMSGIITVVPEPSAVILAAFASLGLLVKRSR